MSDVELKTVHVFQNEENYKQHLEEVKETDIALVPAEFVKTINGNKPDGNGNITVEVEPYVHPNSGVTAGAYNTVTVNEQGHVTGGDNVKYIKTVEGISPDDNGNVGLGLHPVARNGDYNTLNNRPTHPVAWNGDYNSLNNKPYIPPDSVGLPNVSTVMQTFTVPYTAWRIQVNHNGWAYVYALSKGASSNTPYDLYVNGIPFGYYFITPKYTSDITNFNEFEHKVFLKSGDVLSGNVGPNTGQLKVYFYLTSKG